MCEGGKFQKAAAAKEELGETDAPPSYGWGGAHQNTSGGAAGCRGFYRQILVNIPVISPVIPLKLNVSKFCRAKNRLL